MVNISIKLMLDNSSILHVSLHSWIHILIHKKHIQSELYILCVSTVKKVQSGNKTKKKN